MYVSSVNATDAWPSRSETTFGCTLLRTCLRNITEVDPNVYSLRDPNNLPRLTPAVYRIEPEDDLSEVPSMLTHLGGCLEFVTAGPALFLVDVSKTRGLKPERRQQLVTYGLEGDPSAWERFPANTRDRALAVLPFFNLPTNRLHVARRMINRQHPASLSAS